MAHGPWQRREREREPQILNRERRDSKTTDINAIATNLGVLKKSSPKSRPTLTKVERERRSSNSHGETTCTARAFRCFAKKSGLQTRARDLCFEWNSFPKKPRFLSTDCFFSIILVCGEISRRGGSGGSGSGSGRGGGDSFRAKEPSA